MTAATLSPPTSILPSFTRLIEAMKRGLGEGIERWQRRGDTAGETLGTLRALSSPLFNYLAATLRRFVALHARFQAGTLAAAPQRRTPPRAATERPRPERRPPAIPRGPVLLEYCMGHFVPQLRALLDDPEMRALLAASPRAGRLLRPLWRRLTRDPLPEMLRLPRRPRAPRPPAAPTLPGLRLVTVADGTTLWEPIPCYPFSQPPPPTFARAAEPAAPAPRPAPVPPQAAPPPDWGRPAPREKPRIPWAMGLFQR